MRTASKNTIVPYFTAGRGEEVLVVNIPGGFPVILMDVAAASVYFILLYSRVNPPKT